MKERMYLQQAIDVLENAGFYVDRAEVRAMNGKKEAIDACWEEMERLTDILLDIDGDLFYGGYDGALAAKRKAVSDQYDHLKKQMDLLESGNPKDLEKVAFTVFRETQPSVPVAAYTA
jgi:hypothetical protein